MDCLRICLGELLFEFVAQNRQLFFVKLNFCQPLCLEHNYSSMPHKAT